MKINTTITFLFTCFLLLSCKTYSQHTLRFIGFYNGHKIIYKLPVTSAYILTQGRDYHGQSEKIAQLKDSSAIYITDDLKLGGSNFKYKIEKYGVNYELNYVLNDTATLYGIYKGKYWRERKYHNIVVGYYNATFDECKIYDKIIDSVVPQVDKIRNQFIVAPHEASHL